jgi:5-methylcytosine-specific restriction endonuclease McrA
MTEEYKKYLLSDEWAQLKIDLFNYRGKKCEKCGSKTKICVHHKTYDNIFKEEYSDLIILCKICHEKTHQIIKQRGKKKNHKILSLSQKVELKKKNKSAFNNYRSYLRSRK